MKRSFCMRFSCNIYLFRNFYDHISGIPGDGRCLFRSVAHGAYLRAGKPSPSESLQKELADELREKVFIFTSFRKDHKTEEEYLYVFS